MKSIKLVTIFMLLFVAFTAQSQRRFNEKRAQIKSLKIAYLTTELSLTPDEATKFWPLFNAFDDRQSEIRIQKVKAYIDRIDDDILNKMTEKEAAVLVTQMENNEEDIYQNRKKFITSLKGVIPSVKIIKLKRAEDNFNKKLLQQYKDKRRD